ncbi:MAG: molybdate ABC transporter substrate-binding protein [Hyphomicrobiaceae bacterium]
MSCPPTRRTVTALVAALSMMPTSIAARAESALIAVAANFAEAAAAMVPVFSAATGRAVLLTTGSTGKLYAQITEGAPFDILLSADAATPARLIEEGKAVNGSSFTYAIGQLALWSADPTRIGNDGRMALLDPRLRFVAIANPDLAPYGFAAREALQALGLWEALHAKIVMGQNIGQTHSMVATGAAEIGFVALSAVLRPGGRNEGSRWDVPQEMFQPIRQDAVVLNRAADNAAAHAFMEFLRTPQAFEVITAFGYAAEK